MTSANCSRYSRHLLLNGFGEEGQARLTVAKVLIVGAGGLGSPCAMYLAAAGVGVVGIVDADTVSLSNLQRQVIHFTDDVGKAKVLSAADKMRKLNPGTEVRTYETFLTEDNALDIISPYDFVLDCTDSFASKYLVNDACVLGGKPFCCGGVLRYGGQVMTHIPGSACYRCLFPTPPEENSIETCATVGVLSSAVGIMGCIQASEALKYLTGIGTLLTDRLLGFDTREMEFSQMRFGKDDNCPVCGSHPTVTSLRECGFHPCRIKA